MKGGFVKWVGRGKKITKPFIRLYRDGANEMIIVQSLDN